jgi:hypothetical protein
VTIVELESHETLAAWRNYPEHRAVQEKARALALPLPGSWHDGSRAVRYAIAPFAVRPSDLVPLHLDRARSDASSARERSSNSANLTRYPWARGNASALLRRGRDRHPESFGGVVAKSSRPPKMPTLAHRER